MFVEVFQRDEDEVLSRLDHIILDEEMRIEGTNIKVGCLGSKCLLNQVVGLVTFVEARKKLSLSDFRYKDTKLIQKIIWIESVPSTYSACLIRSLS